MSSVIVFIEFFTFSLTQVHAVLDSSKNAFEVNIFIQNPHIQLRNGMHRSRLHARYGTAGEQVGGSSMDGHHH
jgi:hypothetical protein